MVLTSYMIAQWKKPNFNKGMKPETSNVEEDYHFLKMED